MNDPYTFLRERLLNATPALAWQPSLVGWAEQTRTALRTLLGVLEEPWITGNSTLGPSIDESGYVRQHVSFPSREGWNGSGWLLVPDGVVEPVPAVICLPGHGRGADAIVGLVEEPYQGSFALQCVRRGWVTLAVEHVSFGRNRSERDAHLGSSCSMDSLFTLELGETITGWRVRDAMAAARFLCTLPEVDGARIATLGISGGALTALWTGALDESICAVGVSGYFTPMAHSILRFDHCPDNYIPGLAKLLDVPDLAGLVAPRWLAVENGIEDPIFAIEGFREACLRAEKIYSSDGYANRFQSAELNAGHMFDGTVILAHLEAAFA
jgi:dienelactone hydrolase